MSKSSKFYFNTSTEQVEEGRASSWTNRLGPYATREEAENALDTAASRTEAWEEEERREREERE